MVAPNLSLEAINAIAPYQLSCGEVGGMYKFVTDSGVEIGLGFVEDLMVTSAASYQFVISNLSNRKSPRDNKLKATVFAVIEEFFDKNQAAMLYICNTADGKQAMRGRLFEYWFQAYEQKSKYTMLTTTFVEEDGVENFTSVIIRNSNPDLGKVMYEFYETVEKLNEKPDIL